MPLLGLAREGVIRRYLVLERGGMRFGVLGLMGKEPRRVCQARQQNVRRSVRAASERRHTKFLVGIRHCPGHRIRLASEQQPSTKSSEVAADGRAVSESLDHLRLPSQQ